MRAFPAGPVVPPALTRRPDPSATTLSRVADTGRPERSTVPTTASIPCPVAFAAGSRTRMRAGTTRTGARAAIVGPAAAVTVPAPKLRPAVNVAVLSFAVILPSARGATLQVIVEFTAFPKASRTVAVKGRVARAGTPIAPDSIVTRAADPVVTVTVCVPAVAPVADAVTVDTPPRVSR
jgi:hypothetical protein